MGSALDDMEFLARSDHRVEVLDLLRNGPHQRDELREKTGASSSTLGRVLNELEDRSWIERTGQQCEVTQLGAYVVAGTTALLERLGHERRLRDVWQWLPNELPGFSVEMLADANVTVVDPGDPYGPTNRCASFYREAKWLRGFDAGLTAPHHFEELYQRIVDGMETEVILPPEVSQNVGTTYPEKAAQVLHSDAFTLYIHENVPLYRLTVFDNRVGIGGYDPDSGVLSVYVDTDSPSAREWAEATYESFRRGAQAVDPERAESLADTP